MFMKLSMKYMNSTYPGPIIVATSVQLRVRECVVMVYGRCIFVANVS